MNLSTAAASYLLNAVNGVLNNGTLTYYTGSMPSSAQASATGTVLATFTFSATAFGTPSLSGAVESATGSLLTSGTVTPVATGTIGYARAAIVPTTWVTTHTWALNNVCSANSNLYRCTKGGAGATSGSGPTGTTQGISDNAAVWDYYGPAATAAAFADLTVGTAAGNDIVVGTTSVNSGTPITLSSLTAFTAAL